MAGLPFGIFFEAMPTYMRTVHCSLAQIGLMALAQLPWSCKILWSPFIDRYGRFDRWLRGAEMGLALVFVGLAWRHGTAECGFVLPLLVLMATASAVHDTITDAAFIHLTRALPEQDAAKLGSLRISCFKFTMMAGGGLTIAGGALFGWPNTFLGVAALFALTAWLLPPALRPLRAPPPLPPRAFAHALWVWLRRPGAMGTFGFILLYKLGLATLSPMTKPYWVDAGVDQTLLGTLSASVGLLGTVGGAALAGAVGARFVLRTALVGGVVAEALACATYAVMVHLPYSPYLLGLGLAVEGMAQGVATASLVALLARICDRNQAATQFAALTATFGITRALGGILGGTLADHYGYVMLFTWAPLTCLWSLWALPAVQRRLDDAARSSSAEAS